MMFRGCDIGIINKVDLAPLVGASLDRMEADMRRYNPAMKICRTDLKKGEGLGAVIDALLAEQSS
jgi:hydrogenase nickel incorporation protein HypB